MRKHSVFWDDLAGELKDPQFRKQYVRELARIQRYDRIVNFVRKMIPRFKQSGVKP